MLFGPCFHNLSLIHVEGVNVSQNVSQLAEKLSDGLRFKIDLLACK